MTIRTNDGEIYQVLRIDERIDWEAGYTTLLLAFSEQEYRRICARLRQEADCLRTIVLPGKSNRIYSGWEPVWSNESQTEEEAVFTVLLRKELGEKHE